MSTIVDIKNLTKDFKVLNRRSSLKGSIADLFSKDYSIVKAVDGLSLQINEGEIVGFLGPNGAGKSTTIKMMIGVLKQTSGEIVINGLDPYRDHSKYLKDIGVVFGQRTQLWWALPIRESFNILKDIYEVNDEDFKDNMLLFDEIVGINNIIDKPARQLSLGQRTLCDILIAFLHNPKIVFLDEPTIGLDVLMKYKIHKLIKDLNERKKTTVILTTHDMGDVDALCNRVIVINKGKSIYDDSIESLVKFFGEYKTLNIRYSSEKNYSKGELKAIIESCCEDIDAVQVTENEQCLDLLVDERKIRVLDLLNSIQSYIQIADIRISEVSTEDIVRKMYEDGVK
ncbi:ATP-binding cassette domain-containing protein [Clostridium sp. YIM B02505]|uniref:ATP-binding cassette domain-containing protein n=1 Tax=Clostridium yunnanense TaxID=2800325 RepID=A0ABS1EPF1_9CLOT|nr:ATP-binding cassette domain-containing protein [Clostridium yunnanense]MBK1811210.1 ATP-binding cassette domain-containing protein [Clostridium yunnanense]